VVERLTEDQLASLKDWGEGLATVEQAEMQAAGRAIRLLVQEIEALHRELWHRRLEGTDEPQADASDERSLFAALMQRLARRSLST
jgi:hypothetical protein